jgi:hypothetical protein
VDNLFEIADFSHCNDSELQKVFEQMGLETAINATISHAASHFNSGYAGAADCTFKFTCGDSVYLKDNLETPWNIESVLNNCIKIVNEDFPPGGQMERICRIRVKVNLMPTLAHRGKYTVSVTLGRNYPLSR